MKKIRVRDERSIAIDIGDATVDVTMDEAQRLYDELGRITGVRRHYEPRPYTYPHVPWQTYPIITYGTDTGTGTTRAVGNISTSVASCASTS